MSLGLRLDFSVHRYLFICCKFSKMIKTLRFLQNLKYAKNSHFQLPKEVQELEKELLQIAKEKDKVITSQDFEKVFVLLHCCILDIIRSLV